MPTGQVDNTEPPHAQPRAIFDQNAFIVGPAVHDAVAHATDRGEVNSFGYCADDARDSAHT